MLAHTLSTLTTPANNSCMLAQTLPTLGDRQNKERERSSTSSSSFFFCSSLSASLRACCNTQPPPHPSHRHTRLSSREGKRPANEPTGYKGRGSRCPRRPPCWRVPHFGQLSDHEQAACGCRRRVWAWMQQQRHGAAEPCSSRAMVQQSHGAAKAWCSRAMPQQSPALNNSVAEPSTTLRLTRPDNQPQDPRRP
jgi:hypothetical protein